MQGVATELGQKAYLLFIFKIILLTYLFIFFFLKFYFIFKLYKLY